MSTKEVCCPAAIFGRIFRVASIGAAAIALAACGSKNAYVPPPPPKVVVAQPVQKPVTLYLELTGNTQAFNSVDLVARVQGYLESIDYKDGALVTKGTQLFGIERDNYQQQLDQANATLAANEATLEYNTAEYGRQASLARQDFASQSIAQQWKANQDSAAAQVLSAKAQIELAKINLGYTNVLAPFDGVVSNHLVDVGTLVGSGSATKLATIVQMDPMYVYFTMSELQVLRIKESNAKAGLEFRTTNLSNIPVEIGLQGEEGYPHTGHMDYASPQVDVSTGSLTVRALFDNKDRALLPGLFVRVRTPIAHQDKALLVKAELIGTSPGRQLSAGRQRGQCRRAQSCEDWSAARPVSDHRIRAQSRRLGGDRGHSARLSRGQGQPPADEARRDHRRSRRRPGGAVGAGEAGGDGSGEVTAGEKRL